MIGILIGSIEEIYEKELVILVNNVGYVVNVGNTNNYLKKQEIKIYTYTNVKENEISLWGFKESEELEVFKLLLTVSGIGARSASNLVYNLGINLIISAINNKEYKSLKISGIGEKTAQKIVVELTNRIDRFTVGIEKQDFKNNNIVNLDKLTYDEAVLALKQLGYLEDDIIKVITTLNLENITTSSELIKLVLVKI